MCHKDFYNKIGFILIMMVPFPFLLLSMCVPKPTANATSEPLYKGMIKIPSKNKTFRQGWNDPLAAFDEKPGMLSAFTILGRIYPDGSNNNGVLQVMNSGSVKIQLYSNGSSYFNGGNVGIGTNSPAALLDIAKPTQDSNTALSISGNGNLWVNPNPVTGYCNPLVQAGDKAIIFNSGAVDTGALVIGQWSTSAKGIRINSSGNIGIGVTNPNSKLEIRGSTASQILDVQTDYMSGAGNAISGVADQGTGVTGYCSRTPGIGILGQAYGGGKGGYFTSDAGWALQTYDGNVILASHSGNVGIGVTDQFGGGGGVLGIRNASTVPASNPSGGGVLYVQNGALKYRGSSGTVTTIANA